MDRTLQIIDLFSNHLFMLLSLLAQNRFMLVYKDRKNSCDDALLLGLPWMSFNSWACFSLISLSFSCSSLKILSWSARIQTMINIHKRGRPSNMKHTLQRFELISVFIIRFAYEFLLLLSRWIVRGYAIHVNSVRWISITLPCYLEVPLFVPHTHSGSTVWRFPLPPRAPLRFVCQG